MTKENLSGYSMFQILMYQMLSVYILPVRNIPYGIKGGIPARGLLKQLTGLCIRERQRVGTSQVKDPSVVIPNAFTHYIPLVNDDRLNADYI